MFEYIESDLMQREYLIGIADFLLDEFERMFGRDIINRELKLVIYNDPTADFPMLITNTLPMQIRLAQTQLSYWAQTIYQLSHELGHFTLSQRKKNTAHTLKWFEEIVCEAISLYALEYAAANWKKCSLYNYNVDYSECISEYLKNVLSQQGTNLFKSISSISQLRCYEGVADVDRLSHLLERNTLYAQIRLCPSNCRTLCYYQDYFVKPDNVLIDFEKWGQHTNNPIIRCLSTLQPCVQ